MNPTPIPDPMVVAAFQTVFSPGGALTILILALVGSVLLGGERRRR